jgi:hypothetical protein
MAWQGEILRRKLLMALPQCPECHTTAKLAGKLPYCPNCGWNRDNAIKALQLNLKMMPVGILVFVGFVAFVVRGWRFHNPIQLAFFFSVPVLGLLLNFIFTRVSLSKLQALPAPIPRPAAARAETGGFAPPAEGDFEPSPEASAQYQALLRTSRPREIRMSSQGKFGVIAGSLMALGFAGAIGFQVYTKWALHQSFARFQGGDWAMAGVGALLLLLPYGIWRGQNAECDLLENGEVALAKVTQQWTGNKNSASIECEFKDSSGQVRKVISADTTRKLYQGMSVPVFYDRDDPKRQIAYCATLHEVIT